MPVRARLVRDQREVIECSLQGNETVSWAELGRRVGVHATTVAREVDRNGGRSRYSAEGAQARAQRQGRRPRTAKLCCPGPLRDRVTTELRLCRSPAAIAADLRAEGTGERVCVETIYTALYDGALDLKPAECLRRRRRRRRSRQQRHVSSRPGLPNIASRPAVVNDRAVPGHWEGDLIIGARNASAALTLIERQSRYGLVIDLPNGYAATDVLAGLIEAFEAVPAHLRHSLTLDQGSEWAQWPALAATYDLDIWFCDPHSPWQRGTIENFNGHVRFWLPRGQRLDTVTPAQCRHITHTLNNQRRRSLDWASPAQLYTAATTPGALVPAA